MSWIARLRKWLSGTSQGEKREQQQFEVLLTRQNEMLVSLTEEVKALRGEIKILEEKQDRDSIQPEYQGPDDSQATSVITETIPTTEPVSEVPLSITEGDRTAQAIEEQPQDITWAEPHPIVASPETTATAVELTSLEDIGSQIGFAQPATEFPRLDPNQIIEELQPEEIAVPNVIQPEPSPAPALKPAPKDIYIGLDFGTSTTAVAIRIGDELPRAIRISKVGDNPYIPSVVYIPPDSDSAFSGAVVGEDADQPEIEDPYRTIRSVKRCLGCRGDKCRERDMEFRVSLPTGNHIERPVWCQKDGLIHLSDSETVAPEEVATLIIREALQRAIEQIRIDRGINLTLQNVCIFPLNMGCGAKFDYQTRALLLDILQDLGFQQCKIDNVIEEPILAGFAFSRYAENQEGRVLIYDFGGGTFDVALLNIDRISEQEQTGNLGKAGERRVSVIATAGRQWLGGDDIDRLVYEFFADQLANKYSVETETFLNHLKANDLRKLRKQAKVAKEHLSSHEDYQGDFYVGEMELLTVTITRLEFEQLLHRSGLIEKSLEELMRTLRLAECFKKAKESDLVDYSAILRMRLEELASSVDRLVLVGGITKIPLVRQELKQIFGQKIVSDLPYDPVEAVGIGACFPNMVQNFNVVAPPYGYYLEYLNSDTNKLERLTLTEPYEYLGFHNQWTGNALPEFLKPFKVYPDFLHTNLFSVMAGSEESETMVISLGTLLCNDWWFSISLSGMLYLQQPNVNPRFLGKTKQHPIQEEIIAAQKAREQQRRDRQAQVGEGQLITIITEN